MFVTSISYNGSIVDDKRGTCSKTQLKISDNEKNQYIKKKEKKQIKEQKKKQREKQENENKNKARHKNKTQNKTKIKNAKYQQMILENDYINK